MAAIDILVQTVSTNKRHSGYERAGKVAEFATAMITGSNQAEMVWKYRRFEGEPLKEQRLRLYNSLTKYALQRPRKYWKKIDRVPGIKAEITGGDEKKLAMLKENMQLFADNKSLLAWQTATLEYLGSTDPNAWIVYERIDSRTPDGRVTGIKVYPYVLPSFKVVDFKQLHGITEWLVVMEPRTAIYRGQKKELQDYYIYEPGKTTRAREKWDDLAMEPGEVEIIIPSEGKAEPRTFYVSEYLTGTTEVPAMCVGAYRDEKTDLQGFVTWFDPAENVLADLVRDKSNLDVAKTLYAIPQKYEYVKPCQFEDATGGACFKGRLQGGEHDGETCQSCGGRGLVANFTTEQETLQLALPDNPAEMLELSRLYHYETGNIDTPRWLDEQVDKAEARVLSAVFNPGLAEKATGAADKTATEVNYEMEDVYDVLEPFCMVLKLHFELACRIGAQYLEIPGFSVSLFIPKDKKMKSLQDLVQAMDTAKQAGAGWEVIRDIREQLWEKMSGDDPVKVAKLRASYKWLPFDEKSEEERAMILASRSAFDSARVLYENWAEIFEEIENETPEFYKFTHEKQQSVIEEKVEKWRGKIQLASEPTFEPIQP